MLQGHELKLNPNHENYPHDAMHVYAQNAHCDAWKEHRLKLLPGRESTNIATDSKRMTVLNLQMSQCLPIHMKQVVWKKVFNHKD